MERLQRGPESPTERSAVIALTIGALIVAWAVAVLVDDHLRFVVVSPRARTGFEVFLALGQLFAALVLLLFPDESLRLRLRWVAAGLVVFGLGTLGFGYLLPVWAAADVPRWVSAGLPTSLYGSLFVRTVGTGLLAIGLLPRRPPRLSASASLRFLVAYAAVALALVAVADHLPQLTSLTDLQAAAEDGRTVMAGLTGWHWGLSLIPLGLGLAAIAGALRFRGERPTGGWLLIAVVLLTGAHLHTIFWPSAFSTILTTSSLLRLAFTATLTIGGVLALRRVATEREERLASEREYGRRLADLARLRADFTAMVVHELGSSLAAIRRSAELLALDPLSPAQERAATTIGEAAATLETLVADVQTSALVERDDFAVEPRPVRLHELIEAAAVFARALAGDHPLTVDGDPDVVVLADDVRIGQVLRNLLENVARHTPPGTPVALRTVRRGDLVRIEVADAGPGIPPAELTRIFEKFGRGRTASGQRVAGAGLGLYLSRRIIQAHGAELTVASAPGAGTTFGFALERATVGRMAERGGERTPGLQSGRLGND